MTPRKDLPEGTTCEPAPGVGGRTYDICTTPNGDRYLCFRKTGECESFFQVQNKNRVLISLLLSLVIENLGMSRKDALNLRLGDLVKRFK